MEVKWDEEIKKHPNNDNWKTLKKESINNVKENKSIVYYEFLNMIL